MQRKPVDSSNIASIGFNPGPPAVMEIEFKGGGVYQYTSTDDKVVKAQYDALELAESKGKHFTKHIRKDERLTVKKVSG